MSPPEEANVNWSDYQIQREKLKLSSLIRFFAQTESSKAHEIGAIYCEEREQYMQHVLENSHVKAARQLFEDVQTERRSEHNHNPNLW